MVSFTAGVPAGAREIKQIKDAGPKACGRTSRSEDADMRRYRASAVGAVVVIETI
jgi:hypothetical protein